MKYFMVAITIGITSVCPVKNYTKHLSRNCICSDRLLISAENY